MTPPVPGPVGEDATTEGLVGSTPEAEATQVVTISTNADPAGPVVAPDDASDADAASSAEHDVDGYGEPATPPRGLPGVNRWGGPVPGPSNADATCTQRAQPPPSRAADSSWRFSKDDPDLTQVVGDIARAAGTASSAASPPRFGPGARQPPPGPAGAGSDHHRGGVAGAGNPRPGADLARVPDAPAPAAAAAELGDARRSATVLDQAMTQLARDTWPPLTDTDLETSLAAGHHAHAQALADPRTPVSAAAEHAALDAVVDATERAVAVARLGPRHEPGRAPWARAGLVVPVLGATGGVGASVVAAALFDALDRAGVRTLLVDAADPQRSGLASAARNQGAASRTLHPDVGVAFARRGEGWMAHMAVRHGAIVSPSMVPAPSWWLPDAESSAPEVTVVDLGWDSWSMAAAPMRGAGAWLEAGSPAPRPVLVVSPTRPCLAQANQLLARLRPWVDRGGVAPVAGVAVVGARRWPRDVPGVAARTLGPLVSDAVFLPHDAETRTAGVGPRPVSPRLQRAVAPLLAGWNLIPALGRSPKQHSGPYRRT